jgi:hypothetical protein
MVLRVGHDPMTACPFMGSDLFSAAMDLDWPLRSCTQTSLPAYCHGTEYRLPCQET